MGLFGKPKEDEPPEEPSWDSAAVDVDNFEDAMSVTAAPEADDIEEILSTDIATLQHQASRIHAMVLKWTAIVSDLEKQASTIRLAREVRGTFLREDRRSVLTSDGEKVTEGRLEAHALTDAQYLALRRARIDALAEISRAKGILSAVYMKSRIAQALLYSMGQGNRVASQHVERPDLSVEETDGIV